MKNWILISLTLCLGTFVVSAQQAEKKPGGQPVMNFQFDSYDFGEIVEGEDATVDFVFTNTGSSPLIIENVKASCGCTTPFWSKEPVKPGEQGKITAKYNTVNRPGDFNKPITITSNASEPSKKIAITGKVVKEDEISVPEKQPSIFNMGGGDSHDGHNHDGHSHPH